MNWIIIASIAYLLLAVVNLTDKFMVDNVVRSSRLYTFLVCALGSLILVASPWLLSWPGAQVFWLNLLTGVMFAVAQYFLYESLRSGPVSRSLILIGGLIPLFTFLFSLTFLGEQFSARQIVGGVFLLSGIFLVASLAAKRHFWEKLLAKFQPEYGGTKNFELIFLAAFFYAVFFTLSKYIYRLQDFWGAFLWVRLGSLIFVLLLLIFPAWRADIAPLFKRRRAAKKHSRNWRHTLLFLFNQGLGSLSFVLQNYAIFLGSVAVVNALQGVQYGALLIIGLLFRPFFPKRMREDLSFRSLMGKILAICLISLGFFFMI